MKNQYLTKIILFFGLFLGLSSQNLKAFEITLVGDVMLGRLVSQHYQSHSASQIWGDTLPLLKNSDVSLANHEFVLTHSDEKWPDKTFYFKANPQMIKAMVNASFDYVSLANNHAFDFNVAGLKETISILNKNKIVFAGAGLNSGAAESWAWIHHPQKKIAILSLSNGMPEWKADLSKPGIYYRAINQATAHEIIQKINQIKSLADIIIISLHWGRNWEFEPPQEFQTFAHQLIDNGVDIIHGHSPHTIQGIEIYKGKPIFYSLGDFIDDYAVDKKFRNDLGLIAKINIQSESYQIEIIPTHIKRFKVDTAKGENFNWAFSQLKKLSKKFGVDVIRKNKNVIGIGLE